jgi:hypothetical protein
VHIQPSNMLDYGTTMTYPWTYLVNRDEGASDAHRNVVKETPEYDLPVRLRGYLHDDRSNEHDAHNEHTPSSPYSIGNVRGCNGADDSTRCGDSASYLDGKRKLHWLYDSLDLPEDVREEERAYFFVTGL